MAVTANPNIIMGFRAPEIQNPMALAAQGEQIRSSRNQNALAEAQLANAPAEAKRKLIESIVSRKKDILGSTNDYEQANQLIDNLGGADLPELKFKSPEHYSEAKNLFFKPNKPTRPQILQDASGSYTIDPETYEATQIEGVGGKVFAPQKPTPDKLTLGGDESGQYIINMNTGEKTPVLGVKSSPVKPTVVSTEAASEASDVLIDIDALKNHSLPDLALFNDGKHGGRWHVCRHAFAGHNLAGLRNAADGVAHRLENAERSGRWLVDRQRENGLAGIFRTEPGIHNLELARLKINHAVITEQAGTDQAGCHVDLGSSILDLVDGRIARLDQPLNQMPDAHTQRATIWRRVVGVRGDVFDSINADEVAVGRVLWVI